MAGAVLRASRRLATVAVALVAATAVTPVAYAVGVAPISTSPEDGALLRVPPTTVSATYAAPLLPETVISLSLTGSPVPGGQSFADGGRTIVFTPGLRLPDGVYTAKVQGAGSSEWSFEVDTIPPPHPELDDPGPVTAANASDVVVTGTARGSSGVSVSLRDNTGATAEGTVTRDGDRFTAHVDARPLADGQLLLWATSVDEHGTPSNGQRYVTKDATHPVRASTSPPDGATAGAVRRITVEWAEDVRLDEATLAVRDADGDDLSGTLSRSGRSLTMTLDTLPGAGGPYAVVAAATDTLGNTSTTTSTFHVQTAPGTPVCGTLPQGITTWGAPGSPYVLCPTGVTVPRGSTLELDRTAGPFLVVAAGAGGLDVSGTLRTVGADAATAVTFTSESPVPGAWQGIVATPDTGGQVPVPPQPPLLDLDGVVVRYAEVGVLVRHGADHPYDALVRLRNATVTDTSSHGIATQGAELVVESSSVERAGGDGVHLDCARKPDDPTDNTAFGVDDVAVTGTSVTRAAGTGIAVLDCADPVVTGNVVTYSGLLAEKPAMAVTSWESSYWVRKPFRLGAEGGVTGNTGAGNAIDAIAVAGEQRGGFTWVTPVNGETAHPLGYLNLGITVTGEGTVDFPAGSVVKSGRITTPEEHADLHLALESGQLVSELPVTVGEGSVFTSLTDDAAGPATCASALGTGCAPKADDWMGLTGTAGIVANGTTIAYGRTCLSTRPWTEDRRGAVHAARLTVHHCTYGLATEDLTLRDATISDIGGPAGGCCEHGIDATGAIDLADVTLARVEGDAVHARPSAETTARIERLTADATGPVHLRHGASPQHVYRDPVLRDVTVTGSDSLPMVVAASHLDAGPGRRVDRLRGGGNASDVVAFDASFAGDLTWVTPYDDDAVHPLGYGGNVEMLGGTLTVPRGGDVTLGRLRLRGSTFDATAGDATIHGAPADAAWSHLPVPALSRISLEDGGTGEPSRLLLDDVTWNGLGHVETPATGPRPVVRVTGSTLSSRRPGAIGARGVYLTRADTEISSSVLHAIEIVGGGRLHVTDSALDWQSLKSGGLHFLGPGDYAVNRTRIGAHGQRGTGIRAHDRAVVTGSCNAISGAGAGVVVVDSGSSVAIDDSDLYGAATRDVHSTSGGLVSAKRVWWGQAGGPRDEQVEDDAYVDVSDPATTQVPEATVTLSGAKRPDGSYGAGPLTIRLDLNRRMDERVQPVVTVTGSDDVAHPVTGAWVDARTWQGTYEVGPGTAGGRNRVDASAARGCVNDPETNEMAPASAEFDVARPAAPAITGGPAEGSLSGPAPTFTFTGPAGATFACSTGGAWSACSSPRRLTGLPGGARTFAVRAVTADGTSAETIRRWTVDAQAPSVTVAAMPRFQTSGTVRTTWTVVDDGGAGPGDSEVRYRPYGGGYTYKRTTATAYSVAVARGATVCLAVRARDKVGNTSGWSPERCVTRFLDDRSFAASRSWQRVTGTAYFDGTATRSSTQGAHLSRNATGVRRVALLATTCPTCGTVAVYVGGVRVGTVDLRAARTARQTVVVLPPTTKPLSGAVTVRVTTSGRTVEIDGVGLSATS